MKKSSLLALAAFSLFAYPMFAEESGESSEEPVAIETTDIQVSLNDEETKENFIALSDDEEGENVGSYLALSDDEEGENVGSYLALSDDEEGENVGSYLALSDGEEEEYTASA